MKKKRAWQWIGVIVLILVLIAAGFFILSRMADDGKPASPEEKSTTEAPAATETSVATASAAVTESAALPPEIDELTFASLPDGIVLPEDTFGP